jgi:Spy/CpxP family protein refolding chaperone
MKPMKRKIVVVTLSTLLFMSAGAALAFNGHGDCDRDDMRNPMEALIQLDSLSAEQRDEIENIRKATRDALRDLRDKMHDSRTQLQDAMEDNADLETIRGLAKMQGDQVASMIVLRAEVRKKISNLLTEEQRRQLLDLRLSDRGFGKHGRGF